MNLLSILLFYSDEFRTNLEAFVEMLILLIALLPLLPNSVLMIASKTHLDQINDCNLEVFFM